MSNVEEGDSWVLLKKIELAAPYLLHTNTGYGRCFLLVKLECIPKFSKTYHFSIHSRFDENTI